MTQLEQAYFATFTLERLKAFYKAVSKETHYGGTKDYSTEMPIPDGASYIKRAWMKPGGKIIWVKINKRKIRQAIEEREKSLNLK